MFMAIMIAVGFVSSCSIKPKVPEKFPRLSIMVGEDLFYGAYKTFKLSNR